MWVMKHLGAQSYKQPLISISSNVNILFVLAGLWPIPHGHLSSEPPSIQVRVKISK